MVRIIWRPPGQPDKQLKHFLCLRRGVTVRLRSKTNPCLLVFGHEDGEVHPDHHGEAFAPELLIDGLDDPADSVIHSAVSAKGPVNF